MVLLLLHVAFCGFLKQMNFSLVCAAYVLAKYSPLTCMASLPSGLLLKVILSTLTVLGVRNAPFR